MRFDKRFCARMAVTAGMVASAVFVFGLAPVHAQTTPAMPAAAQQGPVRRRSIDDAVATLPGLDGRKMSKSYGNTLPLFAESAQLRKLIRRYVTDSTGPHDPKDPESSGLFQIYREIADTADTQRVHKALSTGEMTWGELKDIVFETLDAFLAEPRERYRELMADKTKINRILAEGADKARPDAIELLTTIREAVGRVEIRS